MNLRRWGHQLGNQRLRRKSKRKGPGSAPGARAGAPSPGGVRGFQGHSLDALPSVVRFVCCLPDPTWARSFVTGVDAALSPEILEPGRRQFGVAHGVLDVLMAEVGLQGAGVMAGIGEGEAASVAPPRRRLDARGCAARRWADATARLSDFQWFALRLRGAVLSREFPFSRSLVSEEEAFIGQYARIVLGGDAGAQRVSAVAARNSNVFLLAAGVRGRAICRVARRTFTSGLSQNRT